MATQPTTGLKYEDLQAFPDDNLRRELIEGELVVTPAPSRRHQQVMLKLSAALFALQERGAGEAYPAPTDVFLSNANVVQPDLIFLRPENLETDDPDKIRKVPDVVVEISSLSTRRIDLTRKKDLYERFGVPEYWFVDLEEERVAVYRLSGGRYGSPEILHSGEALTSPILPDFSFDLSAILQPSSS